MTDLIDVLLEPDADLDAAYAEAKALFKGLFADSGDFLEALDAFEIDLIDGVDHE